MSERQHPLAALTRTRILEFVREPEALFWVFAFPIIMALVLGFAFRDRPPDPVPVGVVAGSVSKEISDALAASGTVKPAAYATLADGLEALRTGKIAPRRHAARRKDRAPGGGRRDPEGARPRGPVARP